MTDFSSFDIVIVGGGPVGNSLACACSGFGFKIALVEREKRKEIKTSSNPKAIALSQSSYRFFETLGIWEELEKQVFPIKSVHVSQKGHFGRTILRPEAPQSALGFVIEGGILQATLAQKVAQLSDVQVIDGVSVTDHRKFNSKPLFIAADGSHSGLRRTAGLPVVQEDYQETAIVVYLQIERDHHGQAYERFTPQGPIALLPFGKKQMKAVWILPTSEAKEFLGLAEAEFLTQLKNAFGFKAHLGSFLSCGPRTNYPLHFLEAQPIFCEGLVVLGNAATTLHPLAAQGLNFALRDVARLAETLVDAKKKNEALGSIETLNRYARWRVADLNAVKNSTDALKKRFTRGTSFSALNSLGLFACDIFDPLKNKITRLGMGILPDLPKLSRGAFLEID